MFAKALGKSIAKKKFYKLARDTVEIENNFRQLCGQMDRRVGQCRLTKPRLHKYLEKKYDGLIAERLTKAILVDKPRGQLTYPEFCDWCEEIANESVNSYIQLKRLAFAVYDVNGDDTICELDVSAMQQHYFYRDESDFSKYYLPQDCQAIMDQLQVRINGKDTKEEAKIKRIFKDAGVRKVDGLIVNKDGASSRVTGSHTPMRRRSSMQVISVQDEDEIDHKATYQIFKENMAQKVAAAKN